MIFAGFNSAGALVIHFIFAKDYRKAFKTAFGCNKKKTRVCYCFSGMRILNFKFKK